MKKSAILTIVISVVVLAGAIGGFVFGRWYNDNRRPNITQSRVVYVYPDTDSETVFRELADSCGVQRLKSLRRCFEKEDVASRLKPGRYEIKEGFTGIYVARMLCNAWQSPCRLTLSGTLRQKNVIAQKIASQMMVDSASVHAALEDSVLLSEYGFTPENVFALLIPDTYEMWWTASVKDILDKQYSAYKAFWTEERKAKAAALKLTPMQVSIVASIVKGESNYVPEFPKIAGVYLNRLRIGMKLQADPTIAYCFDYSVNRILKKHLEVDSPYNTYKHAGLPPAPIYVPTKECLEAVLDPDMTEGNLFFCADPSFNGSHRFAKSYSTHLANARAFQRALNARNAANKS